MAMVTFKEQFPSIKDFDCNIKGSQYEVDIKTGKITRKTPGAILVPSDILMKHCLDKQLVQEAWKNFMNIQIKEELTLKDVEKFQKVLGMDK